MKKIIKFFRHKFYYSINTITFITSKVTYGSHYGLGAIKIINKGNITIGENFKFNSGKNFNPIGGDTSLRLISKKDAAINIGSNVGISNSTIVSWNNITIEDNVRIGGGCKIWDTDFHSIEPDKRIWFEKMEDINVKPIRICKNVFIGGLSIILKGVTIGENSVVQAGSVVVANIPDNEVWGGAPAKKIKDL
jgi:hypothetical protein